jgi:aryl-alcohol dehydrogenase-like predicted oxidoreductase
MEHRRLGRSGLQVPVMTLGTATFGGSGWFSKWGSVGLDGARRMVDLCLEAGATMFDTANSYSGGLAEDLLGQAILGRRDRVLIGTKVNTRVGAGPNDLGSSRFHIMAQCEASLKRLRTDYIDLYQLHGFDAMTPVEETLQALDDLVRAGKVRYVGCSNFSGWHLMKSLAVAERYGFARHVVHQVNYSLAARDYEWELMPLALDQGIGATVWGPLAGAQLSGKVRRDRPLPQGSRVAEGAIHPVDPDHLFRVVDALDEVAAQVGRSVAQVALRWLLQRPTVASVIVGARTEEQLRQNLDAANFVLTPAQMSALDAASAREPAYPYWHQRAADSDRNPAPV